LKVLRIRRPIEELNMRQQSSFSSHFRKISNSFATNFYCSNCEAERLMMISAIEPASRRGRDKVVYQCTDCGTEKTEIAMVYRAPIVRSRGKA
jgi:RNase P subunit RPR2